MFSEGGSAGAIILAIMRYLFRVERFWSDIKAQISRVLPPNIMHRVTDSEAQLVVDTPENLSREHAHLLVERECDRIGFLTGHFVTPVFEGIEHADHVERIVSFQMDAVVSYPLEESITVQNWDATIAAQLRLWHLAKEKFRLPQVRVILLFQIAELSTPLIPPYKNQTQPPDPRTEAKLLRDLASHQDPAKPHSKEVCAYCKWLKIPERFPEPNEEAWRVLSGRIPVLEKLARQVIEQRISRAAKVP